jgi:hypothetical protein
MVYECNDPEFRNFSVTPASHYVLSEIRKIDATFTWNLMISRGIHWGGTGWKLFEDICQHKMLPVRVRKRFQHKCFNGTKFLDGNGNSLALGGCKSIKQTSQDLIDAATAEELVVFHSSNPSQSLFDFIYRENSTYHAFQVTLGETHDCKPAQLLDLANQTTDKDFALYYMLHGKNYKKFKLNPTNPTKGITLKRKWNIYFVRVPDPGEDQSIVTTDEPSGMSESGTILKHKRRSTRSKK